MAIKDKLVSLEDLKVSHDNLSGRIDDNDGDITTLTGRVDDHDGDISDINTALETKAEIDGTYEDMTVGNAEQLASTVGVDDAAPYLFRKTGGTADVGDRLQLKKVVGGSVVWNQMVQNGNFADTSGWTANGGTLSASGNIGTLTVGNNPTTSTRIQQDITGAESGHKYIFSGSIKSTKAVQISWRDGNSKLILASGTITANAWNDYVKVFTATGDVTTPIYFYINRNTVLESDDTVDFKNLYLIDLTAMFGATIADYIYSLETATAGAGVAWLKAHGFMTKDYYPYCEPTLMHVQTSGHKTIGFNQWDEEWEYGLIAMATGLNVIGNGIRSKNMCACLPSTQYYCRFGSGLTKYIFWYDANENHISNDSGPNLSAVTSPSNAHFFRIRVDTISSYANDICINLSDPERNGEYESYSEHSYPLDDSLTLRGIPKLDGNNELYYDGDEYTADGNVSRRYGVITLDGTKGETIINTSGELNNTAVWGGYENTGVANMWFMCDKRTPFAPSGSSTATADGIIWGSRSAPRMWFTVPKTVTNTAELRAYLAQNPITVVYPIGTPTTETAEPYREAQICDPYGTEQYIDTRDVPVPVGHTAFYPDNLRKKIEDLPWNFATLIAPTEKTYTATRNYTTGSLFIIKNILYKATANIANGGTITPGTNCTATTLAEIIAAMA